MCSECTTVPCEHHQVAVARSFAVTALQNLRRQRFIPPTVAVSLEQHEYATAVEQAKLQEFRASRYSFTMENNDCMMHDNDDMQEPTMVQRSVVVSFPSIKDAGITARSSLNKRRSATVTPSPEEARGRCVSCHAPVEFGKSHCIPCFAESPEGRAKRARIGEETTADGVDTDMCLD